MIENTVITENTVYYGKLKYWLKCVHNSPCRVKYSLLIGLPKRGSETQPIGKEYLPRRGKLRTHLINTERLNLSVFKAGIFKRYFTDTVYVYLSPPI